MNTAARDITSKCVGIMMSQWSAFLGLRREGEDSASSDIDLVVRFAKPKSLLSLVRLERQLSTVLGRKVDLLTESAISPYLKDRILNELMVIYGTR